MKNYSLGREKFFPGQGGKFWVLNFEFWVVAVGDFELLSFEFRIVAVDDFELLSFELFWCLTVEKRK